MRQETDIYMPDSVSITHSLGAIGNMGQGWKIEDIITSERRLGSRESSSVDQVNKNHESGNSMLPSEVPRTGSGSIKTPEK